MSPVTVPSTIEHVALIFKVNNDMVGRCLDGVSDDDCWKRPHASVNPMLWLVGHVTISRAHLLDGLGHTYDHGLGTVFDRGAHLESAAGYPSRAAIEQAWRDTRGRMRETFASLTDERLAAMPTGRSLPGVTNAATLISFLAFHESYHVGQMASLRRMLGYSGVSG